MGLKFDMRVIAVSTPTEFWCAYPSAKAPLMVGLTVARNAKWGSLANIKAQFGNASFVG